MVRAAFATEDPTLPVAAPELPALSVIAAAFPELEVVELIGRGGMGLVYKARQKSLNRQVALKLLAPERVQDPQFAERFAREAQALAVLSHPNIVTVHDFGQAGGFYFLLMEFVDGVNLRQAMSAGRFTPDQALAIVPPVCEALQYAHERGIVHRDIKPENLLLNKEGQVKIADFGIAKMLGAEICEPVSQPVGTPRYMAPEQAGQELRVDHRADIYSLGVVLYELLTGELPGSALQPPSQRVQMDVRLDQVVLRALSEKPELRWQTAVEFQTQLSAATQPDASGAEPSPQQRLYHAMGYHTLWGQWLLKLSLLGFLGFLGFVPGWERMQVFSVFLVLMAVGGLVEWFHRKRRTRQVMPARTWWHKAIAAIVMAILIVIPLRAWVVSAYKINGKSLSPEMPPGSQVLVWKLATSFTPGDILAHRHGEEVWVSRVVNSDAGLLRISRTGTPVETIPVSEVIGKVVSVYWRAPAQESTTTAHALQSMRASLETLSTQLGARHPEVVKLQRMIRELEQNTEHPAVTYDEDTSARLLKAAVRPVEFVTERPKFRSGDDITIQSVESTSPALAKGDIVLVKGRWQLQSADEAMLALSVSTTVGSGYSKVLPEQRQRIVKGSGTFALRCSINQTGRLHLYLYDPDGNETFGDLWLSAPGTSHLVNAGKETKHPPPEGKPAPPALPAEMATVQAKIQSAFNSLRKVKAMKQRERYELPADTGTLSGLNDDFLRRRNGRQVYESGLSCGCGDYALAFMHLLEGTGVETLWVDGPEISLRALESHFSGHVVVAVRHPEDSTWVLADPTQRQIIDQRWSPSATSFYDGRYWIGYTGTLDKYPARSPEQLRTFLGQTLAKVPAEVFNQRMFRFRFTVDPSLYGPDGKCLNPRAESLQVLQDHLLAKYKIQPQRVVDMRLVKGGDDALGEARQAADGSWECTVGLQSGCSSGFIDYMTSKIRAVEKQKSR